MNTGTIKQLTVDFSDVEKTLKNLENIIEENHQAKGQDPLDEEYKYELIITRVDNGYILKFSNEFSEVIECDDNSKNTMKRLLEAVADFFGFNYDKFAEDNLKITWQKRGHKL